MNSSPQGQTPTPSQVATKLADWLMDKPTWEEEMGEWRCEMEILWKMGASGVPSSREIEDIYTIPDDSSDCHELRYRVETALDRLLDNGTVTMRELMEHACDDKPSSIFYAAQKFFIPGSWRD